MCFAVRRKDREITDRIEMMDILRRCEVCNVAFADENTPYVVPMNFGVLEANGKTVLSFHCAGEGKKLDMLAKNARVAFSASSGHRLEWEDSGHCTMRYESVCGSGMLRIAGDAEKVPALDAIMDHYRPESVQKKRTEYPEAQLARTTVLMLEVDEMTGKRSAPAKQQG